MRKIPVIFLTLVMLVGCGQTNGLLGTEVQQVSNPSIESGVTASDVVKLFLQYKGYGSYVLAYELLTNEEKRQNTISDIKTFAGTDKAWLEKILSVQEKGDLTLVSAVVKTTDEKTKEVRNEVQDFILKKQAGEWRIIQQNHLNEGQLDILKSLTQQKLAELKNNKEIVNVVEGVKDEVSDTVKQGGEAAKQGISDTIKELKSSLNQKKE
ncbi:hypothetical protein ACFPOG_12550 [Paenibacillus aestuarii]|uniref:DUF4878 domain-containing protein n=1 Tax=Paenibacillus aestuarii TaxID=516965 RepID=A0ABW0K741_9BACL